MKLLPLALTAIFAASLAACGTIVHPSPQMVGGPCRYEGMELVATVTRVFDDGIEFSEADGQTFEIPPQAFAAPPDPGQRYRIAKQYIVQGSCTPYSYHLIGPAED